MSALPNSSSRFSADAETELLDAFRLYAATWADEQHTVVGAALQRLCVEAHARALGPEQMLITIKATWAKIAGAARPRLRASRDGV